MGTLLKSHYESTCDRAKEHKVVLAVQDTSSLNYNTLAATEGLGPINTKKIKTMGLMLHDTMAFTVEGTPLGLLDVQCWARDIEQHGKKKRSDEEPIENKESFKWLKSYRAVGRMQKQYPDTMFVSVGDRESDIYELFAETKKDKISPELLIRSEKTRQRSVENDLLWDKMMNKPVKGIHEIYIPRSGSRSARNTQLEIRYSKVKLSPPRDKKYLGKVTVWAIYVREINHSTDITSPLEWMLLSTIDVSTLDNAVEKVMWYTRRWGIEVYHKTLKSGCKVENRQLGTVDRIEKCLAIDMVVGWRIYYLTKLGRETPDLPCTIYFEEDEWKALVTYKTKSPIIPDKPPSLHEAIRMVGTLGGYLGRKGDGEPGIITIWRGLQCLDIITETWRVFMSYGWIRKAIVPRQVGYG
jgi:hypothetical protein